MIVKAAPGLKVPKENRHRQYITEADAVEVPATAYYLRRLDEGDLVRAEAAAGKAKATATAQAQGQTQEKE